MEHRPVPRGRRSEHRFWSELLTVQLDSWEPRSLPATFRPRSPVERGNRRLVPVLAIVVVLVLVAIAVLSDVPRNLVTTVVNISRSHTVASPSEQFPATTGSPQPSDAAARGGRPSPTAAESAPRPIGPSATGSPGSTTGGPGGAQPGVPAAPVAPPPLPSLPVGIPPLPPSPLPSLPPLPSISPPTLPLPSLPTVPTPPLPTPSIPGL
ncbi:MAG: hypothetical protein M3Z97_15300 [Candidatus Dormibacteraeota bacterium]|nr:hypothetical protein [Candidatus Dormibacteraeota bacterium]